MSSTDQTRLSEERKSDPEVADASPGLIEANDDNEFPEGGLRAWLVAAGVGCVLFSTLGYGNSFGVFQAYYMLHQLHDSGPDDIAWIGSLQAFLTLASGLIGGPLFDRYGAWVSSAFRPGTNVVLDGADIC
jgi:hypothetical protein